MTTVTVPPMAEKMGRRRGRGRMQMKRPSSDLGDLSDAGDGWAPEVARQRGRGREGTGKNGLAGERGRGRWLWSRLCSRCGANRNTVSFSSVSLRWYVVYIHMYNTYTTRFYCWNNSGFGCVYSCIFITMFAVPPVQLMCLLWAYCLPLVYTCCVHGTYLCCSVPIQDYAK